LLPGFGEVVHRAAGLNVRDAGGIVLVDEQVVELGLLTGRERGER